MTIPSMVLELSSSKEYWISILQTGRLAQAEGLPNSRKPSTWERILGRFRQISFLKSRILRSLRRRPSQLILFGRLSLVRTLTSGQTGRLMETSLDVRCDRRTSDITSVRQESME